MAPGPLQEALPVKGPIVQQARNLGHGIMGPEGCWGPDGKVEKEEPGTSALNGLQGVKQLCPLPRTGNAERGSLKDSPPPYTHTLLATPLLSPELLSAQVLRS